MRMLPPLNALKAFEAAARLSSVTAAAEELRVSHSAVSQQIRQLEDYFGCKLFSRPGRRIEPTAMGGAYLEDIRAALDRIAVASERLTQRGSQRQLSINATPSFALRWLIPQTAEFQIANPSIQLRISTSTSDGIDQLDTPFDFIIRRDRMEREGHACHRLLDDRSTPVIAPGLLERFAIDRPIDLLRCPLLHARLRPNAWKQWLEASGVAVPGTVGGTFFDNIFLSVEAAVNGVGVAISPLILVEEDLKAGRLIAPFPELFTEGPGFHVLFRPAAAAERNERRFLTWLEEKTGARLREVADPAAPLGGDDEASSSART
jgi:LysR family glycine cleavage system transcriptional activator